MRWPMIALLGLVSYLLFLLHSLPAPHIIGWLAGDGTVQGVSILGASGTVWEGSARQVSYQRRPLGALTWDFLPSRLLLGKLAFDIELKEGGQQLQGTLLLGGSSISLQDVDALLLASRLPEWLGQRQIGIDGKLRLQQLDLSLSEGRITAAEGRLEWLQGSLRSPLNLRIGDLQAELSTDEASGDIQAQIKDPQGNLGLSAQMLLKPDGNFQLDGRLKPGERADPGLTGALQAIGRRQPDGTIQLKYAGKI
jgi:general secretion pathway protein N